MNVLILADGTSIHTHRILEWHLKCGCNVTFIDYFNPQPQCDGNFRFVRYPGLPGARYVERIFGHRRMSTLNDLVATRGLRRIYREAKPDVVHLYQIDSRAHHCTSADLRPLVMSSWGSDINRHFLPSADDDERSRLARSMSGANLVIADSHDIIDKCKTLAGATLPTELLALGIDTQLFRPCELLGREWRRSLDVPEDAALLLSIRALTPLYGHESIMRAFQLAMPHFNRNAFLVFKDYNSRGVTGYRRQLEQLGEQLGISQSLRWCDNVCFEQLPNLYSAATAVVNYPSMDGFPVTFFEAAACKCPVITNRLPAYQGTFAEIYFYMTEVGDVDALANMMVHVVNQQIDKRDPKLDEVRALIENEFDQSASIHKLMSIYHKLASVRRN